VTSVDAAAHLIVTLVGVVVLAAVLLLTRKDDRR
jgi:inner membrane protein involved in colicin E2 resistance